MGKRLGVSDAEANTSMIHHIRQAHVSVEREAFGHFQGVLDELNVNALLTRARVRRNVRVECGDAPLCDVLIAKIQTKADVATKIIVPADNIRP